MKDKMYKKIVDCLNYSDSFCIVITSVTSFIERVTSFIPSARSRSVKSNGNLITGCPLEMYIVFFILSMIK